jgi:hypothetical protein
MTREYWTLLTASIDVDQSILGLKPEVEALRPYGHNCSLSQATNLFEET